MAQETVIPVLRKARRAMRSLAGSGAMRNDFYGTVRGGYERPSVAARWWVFLGGVALALMVLFWLGRPTWLGNPNGAWVPVAMVLGILFCGAIGGCLIMLSTWLGSPLAIRGRRKRRESWKRWFESAFPMADAEWPGTQTTDGSEFAGSSPSLTTKIPSQPLEVEVSNLRSSNSASVATTGEGLDESLPDIDEDDTPASDIEHDREQSHRRSRRRSRRR